MGVQHWKGGKGVVSNDFLKYFGAVLDIFWMIVWENEETLLISLSDMIKLLAYFW